ncbi:unnamed protein product, partial [marine sediment metagenome]
PSAWWQTATIDAEGGIVTWTGRYGDLYWKNQVTNLCYGWDPPTEGFDWSGAENWITSIQMFYCREWRGGTLEESE